MISIDTEHIVYKMSKENVPAAYCQSGDIVVFHILDCYGNKLLPKEAKLGIDNPPLSNPATGPLYVNGAMHGDTLKIEIIDIQVGTLGINIVGPSSDCLRKRLNAFEIRRIPVLDGMAKLTNTLSVPRRKLQA